MIVMTILVVAVVAGRWIWGHSAWKELDEQIAAYRAAGEPIEVDDFIGSGVPDADNAALALRSACRWINKLNCSAGRRHVGRNCFPRDWCGEIGGGLKQICHPGHTRR